MLYYFFRPITRIALKAYFRRITLNGLDNLPTDGPLLLCSNHPTGFLEPCLMACFFPRVLHFLVRADLFERPLLGFLMRETNQIPIFRMVDGYDKLRNSRDIMNLSYTSLGEGKAILIFPEASTIEVKNLRPIKKGVARMAMETLAQYPDLPLKIIPIGVNYSNSNKPLSIVTINIGEPITPTLPEDSKLIQKQILSLTREIESKMSDQLLEIKNPSDAGILDDLLAINQWKTKVNASLFTKYDDYKLYNEERHISKRLSALDEKTNLTERLTKLKSELQDKDLSLEEFAHSKPGFIKIFAAFILVIPTLFFLALSFLPVYLGKTLRDKYVYQNEFIGSVLVGAAMGSYIVFFIIGFVILLIFKGFFAFALFLIPFLGLLGLRGFAVIKDVYVYFKLRKRLGKSKIEAVYEEGQSLITTLIN